MKHYHRKSRSIKQKKTKNSSHTRRRKQTQKQKQHGGGYAYTIPSNAIVVHRSMDDEGTNPPVFMTKRLMDEVVQESERA